MPASRPLVGPGLVTSESLVRRLRIEQEATSTPIKTAQSGMPATEQAVHRAEFLYSPKYLATRLIARLEPR